MPPIRYTLRFPAPQTHTFDVEAIYPAEDAAAIYDLTGQALAASPELVPAHVLLGDLEYTRGNRDAAAIAWWRAKALAAKSLPRTPCLSAHTPVSMLDHPGPLTVGGRVVAWSL